MSEETITFKADIEPVMSLLRSVRNVKPVAERVQRFLKSCVSLDEAVRFDSDASPAIANEITVRFYPSQGLLDAIAAPAADDGNSDGTGLV